MEILLSIAGVVIAWLAAGTSQGRAIAKSAYVYQVIMFPKRKWHLPKFLGMPITRQEPIIHMPGRTLQPDLYRVGQPEKDKKRPGLIIISPLSSEGKRDKNVVNFLSGLARAGFVVLVSFWPDRPIGMIDTGDVQELEKSLEYLINQPDVDPKRVGIVSISYGTGPTLIVASNPEWRDKIQYIMSIGGYTDLWSLFRFAGSGRLEVDGKVITLKPDPYMQYVFLRTLSNWIGDKHDQEIIDNTLNSLKDIDDPVDLDVLRSSLSAKSQKIIDALRQAGSLSTQDLRAAFPANFQENADSLSLNQSMIDNIKAQVMILHTMNDKKVPYSESIKLHQMLEHKQEPIAVTLQGFDHAVPPAATPMNLLYLYMPNALRLIPLLYSFFRLQEVPLQDEKKIK
jgi:hypothetical protein